MKRSKQTSAEIVEGSISLISNQRTKLSPTFSQLEVLNDDTIVSVLAFVGDAPFELLNSSGKRFEDGRSTMTDVLPYVSKKIYFILKNSDYLWKLALIRLVSHDPLYWVSGLQHFILKHSSDMTRHNERCNNEDSYPSRSDLIKESIRILSASEINDQHGDSFSNAAGTKLLHHRLFKWIFKWIKTMSITSPLFHMPGNVRLGSTFGLHFFEPRYRTLIGEVMAPFPPSARQGETISPTSSGAVPTFIYANCRRLAIGATVTVVQVTHCEIFHDGTADVELKPMSYARISQVWERPDSGRLCEASALKLDP